VSYSVAHVVGEVQCGTAEGDCRITSIVSEGFNSDWVCFQRNAAFRQVSCCAPKSTQIAAFGEGGLVAMQVLENFGFLFGVMTFGSPDRRHTKRRRRVRPGSRAIDASD
jgi:hypothetical protein